MPDPVIQTRGLKELRRDLRRLDPATDRAVARSEKEAGEIIVEAARPKTPYAQKRRGAKVRRHLREATQARVTLQGLKIVNPLAYANLIHWGGGTPSLESPAGRQRNAHGGRRSLVRGTPFIEEAVNDSTLLVLSRLESNVESALAQTGWK